MGTRRRPGVQNARCPSLHRTRAPPSLDVSAGQSRCQRNFEKLLPKSLRTPLEP